MADFEKVMEGPSAMPAPVPLSTNTGSLATDLTAAAGFGLQLLDRYNQGQAQEAQQQAQLQAKEAMNRGELMAKRNASTLLQLEGTEFSLKRRQFETEALNRLSPLELEGYLAGAEKFGMGSALKDTIDSRRKEVDAELKYNAQMVQKGQEAVMAMAAGADPQGQQLYANLLEGGLTEEELFSIAQTNDGIQANAARISAVNAATQSQLGLEKTQQELVINQKTNEFILGTQNRLTVASTMFTRALGSGNQSDIVAAGNEYKRQVAGAKVEYDNFLRTLPPESMKYLDLQKQTKTLNDAFNQMNTIIDNADPKAANDRMVSLALQGTMAGLLVKGTPEQKQLALEVFMKVPVDSANAQVALQDLMAESNGNANPFESIANNLSDISSGVLKVQDPKFSGTLKLLSSSLADIGSKVPAVAEISLQGAYESLPAPGDLENTFVLRDKVSREPGIIQDFREYLAQKGEDPWDTLRINDQKVLKNRLWPDLKRFGFEQGNVQFRVENGRIRADFTSTVKDTPQSTLLMSDSFRTELAAKRKLNQATALLERMAKSASALGEIPEQDAMKVYVATMNEFMGSGAKPEGNNDAKN